VKIEHLYTPDVYCCGLHERLVDAATRMHRGEIGSLAVVDDVGSLVAILSERDLVRALADRVDPDAVEVVEYATDSVALARVDEDSAEVARRMLDSGIRHVPVMAGSALVGMVSMRDLLALQTWA
jgi:CBS domain-containing protein